MTCACGFGPTLGSFGGELGRPLRLADLLSGGLGRPLYLVDLLDGRLGRPPCLTDLLSEGFGRPSYLTDLVGGGLGRPILKGFMVLLRVPDNKLFMFLVDYEKHINARRHSLLDTMFHLSWKNPVMVLQSNTIRKIQSSSIENLQLPCDVYVVWCWSSDWLKKTSSAVASTCSI